MGYRLTKKGAELARFLDLEELAKDITRAGRVVFSESIAEEGAPLDDWWSLDWTLLDRLEGEELIYDDTEEDE